MKSVHVRSLVRDSLQIEKLGFVLFFTPIGGLWESLDALLEEEGEQR